MPNKRLKKMKRQRGLKALPESDTKKCQNSAKPQAKASHIRMIDLNLFRVLTL